MKKLIFKIMTLVALAVAAGAGTEWK